MRIPGQSLDRNDELLGPYQTAKAYPKDHREHLRQQPLRVCPLVQLLPVLRLLPRDVPVGLITLLKGQLYGPPQEGYHARRK